MSQGLSKWEGWHSSRVTKGPFIEFYGGNLAVNCSTKGLRRLPEVEVFILFIFVRTGNCSHIRHILHLSRSGSCWGWYENSEDRPWVIRYIIPPRYLTSQAIEFNAIPTQFLKCETNCYGIMTITHIVLFEFKPTCELHTIEDVGLGIPIASRSHTLQCPSANIDNGL